MLLPVLVMRRGIRIRGRSNGKEGGILLGWRALFMAYVNETPLTIFAFLLERVERRAFSLMLSVFELGRAEFSILSAADHHIISYYRG